MQIIAVQLDSVWEDKVASFARVERLLDGMAPEPDTLIVLPEMFATGFSLDADKTVEVEEGGTQKFLRILAQKHDAAVLGGVVSRDEGGRARNQAVVFLPNGERLACYTKQRPFSGAGEDDVHARGEQAAVFDWAGVKFAPLICYDLRFPELFRDATRLGAEMFIVIAAWPVKRIEHWITLLRARAIENQAFVVGVNRTGREPKFDYCGRSIVVDPHGDILADAGESEGVLRVNVEVAVARSWRAEFPAVRDFLRWTT